MREIDHDAIMQEQNNAEPNLKRRLELHNDVIDSQQRQDNMLAFDPLREKQVWEKSWVAGPPVPAVEQNPASLDYLWHFSCGHFERAALRRLACARPVLAGQARGNTELWKGAGGPPLSPSSLVCSSPRKGPKMLGKGGLLLCSPLFPCFGRPAKNGYKKIGRRHADRW